jgi:hypothetical protein
MRETGQGVQTSAGLDVEELATRKESEFSNALSSFLRFLSVLISVHLWFQILSRKRSERLEAQGVVAGTEALGRAQWRRNRGDERRHIASARHRGSEGAQAISRLGRAASACLLADRRPAPDFGGL